MCCFVDMVKTGSQRDSLKNGGEGGIVRLIHETHPSLRSGAPQAATRFAPGESVKPPPAVLIPTLTPLFEKAVTGPFLEMAEREGFEPPVRSHVQRISSAPHSTTLAPLRITTNLLQCCIQRLLHSLKCAPLCGPSMAHTLTGQCRFATLFPSAPGKWVDHSGTSPYY